MVNLIPTKVLVCGGRDYIDYTCVCRVLDDINISCLIHGGARGADSLAQKWAEEHNVLFKRYDADWDTYGRAAGPIRNQQMLDDNPDIGLVVAFPGGIGTADMMKKAKQHGIRILEVL